MDDQDLQKLLISQQIEESDSYASNKPVLLTMG